jgi:CheY-like chemotaxis protein
MTMAVAMADLSGRRILVVEDETAIALDLARLLGDYGATVVGPVASAEEALRSVTRKRIHCAVLDVKLRGGDCALVAETLSWNLVPFIFVTAYANSEVVTRYLLVAGHRQAVRAHRRDRQHRIRSQRLGPGRSGEWRELVLELFGALE